MSKIIGKALERLYETETLSEGFFSKERLRIQVTEISALTALFKAVEKLAAGYNAEVTRQKKAGAEFDTAALDVVLTASSQVSNLMKKKPSETKWEAVVIDGDFGITKNDGVVGRVELVTKYDIMTDKVPIMGIKEKKDVWLNLPSNK